MNGIPVTQLIAALLEGVGLILSPCILPILPIMLASSLDGGKARPLGIISGFIASFTAFALLSRQLLAWLPIDPGLIRNLALGLLVIFGLVMMSSRLSDGLLRATQGLANFGENLASRWTGNGFASGLGIGSLIGLIWAPCAGPIMAAALLQIIQSKTGLVVTLTVLMFALGAGLPMLLIALAGRRIMNRLTFLKTHSTAVKRAFGIIVIATALLIYSGADVELLAASGSSSPDASVAAAQTVADSQGMPMPAPEIAGIKGWINSDPLTIAGLHGKVILIDFWTYSCINCVRTLPYLTSWDAKYRDKGLVIIGVHAPEFEFEKKFDNVKAAVAKYGIKYPVALDSELVTWSDFKNQYWPAHYLIDKNGQIVYSHFGEGAYDLTETKIRALLGLGPEATPTADPSTSSNPETPETYLGYARAKNFSSNELATKDAVGHYSIPNTLSNDAWALSGAWYMDSDSITARDAGAKLRFHFVAGRVYAVLGTTNGSPVIVNVRINGRLPDSENAGSDVKNGILTVDHQGLYEIAKQYHSDSGTIDLQADSAGLQAYTFTFGD